MISWRPSPRIRRWLWLIVLLIALPVSAREFMQGDTCTIGAQEHLQTTLFVFCEVLDVQGTIEGNVIGFALRARIDGTLNGSLYLTGGQLDVYGHVRDSVHFAGVTLRVMPDDETDQDAPANPAPANPDTPDERFIGGDLFSASLSTRLYPRAQLMGEAISLGYQFVNEGTIERNISFWGSGLRIYGRVHGDVYADVGDPGADSGQIETLLLPFQFDIGLGASGMTVAEGAVIRGALTYTSPADGLLEGRILQGVSFDVLPTIVLPTLEEPRTLTIYFDQFMREATTLMSIGLLLLFVAPNIIQQPLSMMRSRPVPSVIVGMLSFIISFPIVLILLVMSVFMLIMFEVLGLRGVTIAGGVVLGLLNIGGISLFYFMAIFVARTLVGLALGRVLLRLLMPDNPVAQRMSVQIIVGTLVLALSASLPVIGWVFNALALFLGLGAILTVLLAKFQQMRESNPPIAPYATRDNIARPRPVMPHIPIVPPRKINRPSAPALPSAGMQDLPEGFDADWFFDE